MISGRRVACETWVQETRQKAGQDLGLENLGRLTMKLKIPGRRVREKLKSYYRRHRGLQNRTLRAGSSAEVFLLTEFLNTNQNRTIVWMCFVFD